MRRFCLSHSITIALRKGSYHLRSVDWNLFIHISLIASKHNGNDNCINKYIGNIIFVIVNKLLNVIKPNERKFIITPNTKNGTDKNNPHLVPNIISETISSFLSLFIYLSLVLCLSESECS